MSNPLFSIHFLPQSLVANIIRVPVKVHVFPGLPHGFRRFDGLPSSRRWDQLVIESIKWSLNNQTVANGMDLTFNVE